MTLLIDYVILILPGLALLLACFWFFKPEKDSLAAIGLLVISFVFIRDAMTPVGLWSFGITEDGAPWMRMTNDRVALIGIGMGSLILVFAITRMPRLAALIRFRPFDIRAVVAGILGGAVAAAPVLALSLRTPLDERGGAVAVSVLPALAFMCLFGNLAEEVIFRGLL